MRLLEVGMGGVGLSQTEERWEQFLWYPRDHPQGRLRMFGHYREEIRRLGDRVVGIPWHLVAAGFRDRATGHRAES